MHFLAQFLLLIASWCGYASSACAQATQENVMVDLQPCIIAGGTTEKDVSDVAEAYLFQEFFKGFWGASQYYIIAPDAADTLDLTVDENHGRCNVVMVGTSLTSTQVAQLTAYSQRFQVRIVYFDEASAASDVSVMARLGLSQYFAEPLLDLPIIQLTENAISRVVNPALQTDPVTNNIFARPVIQVTPDAINGTTEIVAEYADASGNSLAAADDYGTYPSVAACTYLGNDGEEEMYIFFSLAWFDLGSWAWAHYIAEWGTKGIFAGERRFLLGAMVDDLFLETNVFEFMASSSSDSSDSSESLDSSIDVALASDSDSSSDHEGELVRMTSGDLADLLASTEALNMAYSSEIITEFPFNGYGILEKVNSGYLFSFDDADAALLSKGDLPTTNTDGTLGMDSIIPTDWWTAATIAGLQAEFDSSVWNSDDLLDAVMELKEHFFWQSHTMTHLARDNLSASDCNAEDGGNAQIAVITGLFDSDTYDWRSVTTPGITGLFNKNCLSSAADNLIMCAPGDNTYDGILTDVSLISSVSQFHSIYTTEAEVGFEGFQIVPRFATFVYFNCASTDCLILENLHIRRGTCKCDNVDPGTIGNLNTDTTGCDITNECPLGLQAFETVENLFEAEALTTVRLLLSGRRDKYMFHQANVIPTTVPSGYKSLLEYWYEVILAELAKYINMEGSSPFPVRSIKFDDLCTNFRYHEDLDNSGALVTVTITPAGSIAGMTLSASSTAGVIPVTIPTSFVNSVSTDGLPSGQPYMQEHYGSDTTFYIATSSSDEPVAATKPSATELATPLEEVVHTPAPQSIPTPTPQGSGDDGEVDSDDHSRDDSRDDSSDDSKDDDEDDLCRSHHASRCRLWSWWGKCEEYYCSRTRTRRRRRTWDD